MKLRLLILILWPAFLVAGLAEGLLFSFIRPEDLIFFGHHLALAEDLYPRIFYNLDILRFIERPQPLYFAGSR